MRGGRIAPSVYPLWDQTRIYGTRWTSHPQPGRRLRAPPNNAKTNRCQRSGRTVGCIVVLVFILRSRAVRLPPTPRVVFVFHILLEYVVIFLHRTLFVHLRVVFCFCRLLRSDGKKNPRVVRYLRRTHEARRRHTRVPHHTEGSRETRSRSEVSAKIFPPNGLPILQRCNETKDVYLCCMQDPVRHIHRPDMQPCSPEKGFSTASKPRSCEAVPNHRSSRSAAATPLLCPRRASPRLGSHCGPCARRLRCPSRGRRPHVESTST